MVIPLFSTDYSIGQSILTSENETEIVPNSPVSIIAIAKTHGLSEIYNVEDNFSGFIKGHLNYKKNDIKFRFGFKICVCSDIADKSEESLATESNVIVWLLNESGYTDALKIYNQAATEGFYYIPRTDWANLNSKATKNLGFSFPFYSSFLAKNRVFNYKYDIIPDLSKLGKVNFFTESHELPFDPLLEKTVNNFCGPNGYEIQKSHTCYYYKNIDWRNHMIFRCINQRTTFDKPNLSHYSSDKFSFEAYLNEKI